MQCNLLCLIINLLLFYEQRQIVFANQNDNDTKNDDELLGHLTTIGSVDLDVEPESTEQVPQPTPKTLNQLNGTTEELGLEISKILNDFFASGYDRRVRPNYAKPVEVGVTMFVISISSVSEVQMDFTSDFYFRQIWKDPRLSFSPTNGITQIFVGAEVAERIWVPDTFFANEKSAYFHIATTANTFLRINSDGEVLRSIRLTVTASCPMDLQYFPMDRQLCSIEIESYGYSMADIKYRWAPVASSVGLAKELSLPQFKVLGHRQKEKVIDLTTGNYSRLICEIQFARSLGFYLIQIYIPASLIVVISWVSFWLHRNATPARVSLGVTTVLTMTTLMSSTNAQLPKISYIKSIDVFLGTCFVMVFGSLLEYAIVGYFGKRISMRKSRSEQLNKAAVLSKSAGDAEQLKQQSVAAANQLTGFIAPQPIYNQQANLPYPAHSSLIPIQQLRSPSFYQSGNLGPSSPNLQAPSSNAPQQAPNIQIIETSSNPNNLNNEPIYDEHTLHPPSLPSLPSNEMHPQYLPMQPRSHSADNYTAHNPHLIGGGALDPRFLNPTFNYPFKPYDVRSPLDGKFKPPPFHSHPDYYRQSAYYSSLPFHPYNAHQFDDLYNDQFASHMSSTSNLPYHNPYHHHSMSFPNKFTHYYPYHPNYYQPFYYRPDYALAPQFRQSDAFRRHSYLDYDYLNHDLARFDLRNRLNTTQLSVYNPSIQESRYSKYASSNKPKSTHPVKKSKSDTKDEDEELLLERDAGHFKQQHEKQYNKELNKHQLANATKNQKLTNKSLSDKPNSSPLSKPINRSSVADVNLINSMNPNLMHSNVVNPNLLNVPNQMTNQMQNQVQNQMPNQIQNQMSNPQQQQLHSPKMSDASINLINQRSDLNPMNQAPINSMHHTNKRIKSIEYEPLTATTQLTSNHKATITATSTRRGARFNRIARSVLLLNGCSNPNKICGLSPSDIDKYSRVIFPVCFICFNLMYWIIYLHISTDIKTDLVPLGG